MRKYLILYVLLFYTVVLGREIPTDLTDSLVFPNDDEVGTYKDSSVRKRYVFDEEQTDIVFPGEISRTRSPLARFSGNATGKGTKCIYGVCEEAIDYPYDYIKGIKDKLIVFKDTFGSLDGTALDLGVRRKPGEADYAPLCTTSVYTRYPKTLKNEKNVEKFIVNVEGHRQGLIFETCGRKATCIFAPLFPSTYTSECTQRYMTRRLMALGDKGDPEFDSFVIPSCCMCMVKQIKQS